MESRERTANLTQKGEGYQNEERNADCDKERENESRMRRPWTDATASAASLHTWSVHDNSDCSFCGRAEHESSKCIEYTVNIRREKLK